MATVNKQPCETCDLHETTITSLREISLVISTTKSDLQWIISVGRWLMGLIGGIICLVLPFFVGLLIYISNIGSRCALLESKVSEVISDFRLDQVNRNKKQ